MSPSLEDVVSPGAEAAAGADSARVNLHAAVVAVGGSVGGLEAFTKLLEHLAPDSGMAFVFLQHLDPRRDSLLVQLLSAPSRMPVREIRDEMVPAPNEVYIVPSAHCVSYELGAFKLGPRRVPAVPSGLIDDFMSSLAAALGSRAVGVILSGNGRDGVVGLDAIRRAGGVTFCQTPASARSAAMPRAAMAAGVVDFVLAPEQIASELTRVGHSLAGSDEVLTPEATSSVGPRELARLFALLRTASNLDFAQYKPATVRRRIERRMRLSKHDTLAAYLEHVQENAAEAALLQADLLIGVTRLFRDGSAFAALTRQVLPRLVDVCAAGGSLRIWVAACATGEEAYSIAICVLECFGQRPAGKAVQIFATDVNDAALARARAGVYPESIRAELSPERLDRFFVKHRDGYQVAQEVRELCVFAHQDVILDPAFSKLDLISCRNLLIYLRPDAQRRVLSKFHHALAADGVLLLGGSESVSNDSLLFARVDAQERLYKRRGPPSASAARVEVEAFATSQPPPSRLGVVPMLGYDVRKEADRVLLGRFVAAAILVDAELQVVQFRGQTGPFMGPLSGAASLSVLKLLDESLLPAVRYGIASVHRTRRAYRRKGFVAELQGVARALDLEILPLRAPQSTDPHCLIVLGHAPRAAEDEVPSNTPGRGLGTRLVAQLREELAMARDQLQASVAEQESSNESLRAALEELQSTNEELQVTNEELETGKEELQSTNEQLTVAHDEVQMRNAELSQLIHDQVNLVAAASVAALLFGCDMRLRRFTPIAATVMKLTNADIGRPLADLQLGFSGSDLTRIMTDAIAALSPRDAEVHDGGVGKYAIAMHPYRSLDGSVDGVVMTVAEITSLRAAEEALAHAQQRIVALEQAAIAARTSN